MCGQPGLKFGRSHLWHWNGGGLGVAYLLHLMLCVLDVRKGVAGGHNEWLAGWC